MASGKKTYVIGLFIVASFVVFFYIHDFHHTLKKPRPGAKGVLYAVPSKMQPGLNVMTTYIDNNGCNVFDDGGKILSRFPGRFCKFIPRMGLLTSFSNKISLLDSHLNPIWQHEAEEIHHDVTVSIPRGEIFYLDTRLHAKTHFCEDILVGLKFSGEEIFRMSITDLLPAMKRITGGRHDSTPVLSNHNCYLDPTHTNSVDVVPPGFEERGVFYKPGNILLSVSEQSILIILDRKSGKIVWSYHQDGYEGPFHSARFTKDGNIVVFKNVLETFGFSEILIIDPVTLRTVWNYSSSEVGAFVSEHFGNVQPLDNGNLLVTDNPDGGRVFEITPQKEIVWEWVNDTWADDEWRDGPRRKEVFKVLRVSDSDLADFHAHFE